MTAGKRSLMHPHPQATRHKSLQTQVVTHCSWLHKGQMSNNLLRISANLIAQSVFHSNLFRWQHNHSLSNWTIIPRVKHIGISQKRNVSSQRPCRLKEFTAWKSIGFMGSTGRSTSGFSETYGMCLQQLMKYARHYIILGEETKGREKERPRWLRKE